MTNMVRIHVNILLLYQRISKEVYNTTTSIWSKGGCYSHHYNSPWKHKVSHSEAIPSGMPEKPVLSTSIVHKYHQHYRYPESMVTFKMK